MKRSSLILGTAFVAGFAAVASKRLKPPLAPEGLWKDVSSKPSINGSSPA
ncbi:MAG: hypothetical protein WD178_02390 [Actinomycetota bacterium]